MSKVGLTFISINLICLRKTRLLIFTISKSKCPYESSKYAIDVVAVAMNDFLNRRNIKSFTTHPGVVATNIVRSHMPWIMGKVMENLFSVVS